MKYIIILSLLFSCTSDIQEPDLIKAVIVQESATKTIDVEAGKIIKVAKVTAVKDSAKIILVENGKLKENINVLAGADEALAHKDKEIAEWKEKYESRISSFVFFLQSIGVLSIAIGLFLCFQVSKGYFMIVIGGLSLLVCGMIVNFILIYEKQIVIGILVIGAVTVFRLYYSQGKAVDAAVKLADDFKEFVPKDELDKRLGHEGTVKNCSITKNIINRYKK